MSWRTRADRGGYVDLRQATASWWIPSGRVFFSPDAADDRRHRNWPYARAALLPAAPLPRSVPYDAVSTESFVAYDAYDLLVVETRDAVGTASRRQRGTARQHRRNDYRVLQPRW